MELFAFMLPNIAESLRNSLQTIVAEQGTHHGESAISETTLIRNGSFCGRRFSLAGYTLVWFQEEGHVKFYSPHGTLEQSCSVAQFCMRSSQSSSADVRRAA